MIINHNMKAMNAHRMMGINASTMGKSTEKLSSGLRVNRAADDAAGLSISEKMRGQIRGLTQASRNAQDAISVVQTAEGALDEAHSILQRMRQLAVQSANDSNVSVDRAAIQQEVTQLTAELDRIAETTEFNTKTLLDGTFKNNVFHVGANQDQKIEVSIEKMSAEGLGLKTADNSAAAKASLKQLMDESISSLNNNYKTNNDNIKTLKKSIGELNALASSANDKIASLKNADSVANAASILEVQNNSLLDIAESLATKKESLEGKEKEASKIGADLRKANEHKDLLEGVIDSKGGIYVGDQKKANVAITTINDALSKVSKQRSELGAIQNRMEHTIKNLDNAAENLQAAESRVRDVDMALEMSNFTKKNILTQASQAMLAQANQLPQQVLQLLR